MSNEELLDFGKFYKKHQDEFEIYSQAYYFGIGFFISRGFSWSESANAAKQELIQLW